MVIMNDDRTLTEVFDEHLLENSYQHETLLNNIKTNTNTIQSTLNSLNNETLARMNADLQHKNSSIIDHPDNSIITSKISDNAITDEKIGFREIDDPKYDDGKYAGFLTFLLNSIVGTIRAIRTSFNKVDNTSDLDKPISTATKYYVDTQDTLKENKSNKGVANGYAALGSDTKLLLSNIPDVLMGQVLYGGTWNASTSIATLSTNVKTKLGTSLATITLTNNTNTITGYVANEGNYYITSTAGTFASITFEVGDWLISTGSAWQKIYNTDAVTGVKGNSETIYRIGNINLTKENIGLGNVQNIDTTNASNITSGTMSPSRISQDTNNRFVTDAQITNWNANGSDSGGVTGVKGNSESTYRTGQVNITALNIGLGNVEDTSDLNKPISTKMQIALDSKAESGDVVKKTGDTMTGGLTNEKYIKTPWVQQGNWVEAYLGQRSTTQYAANEKFDVIFGKVVLGGWFEIEVASGYNYGNSSGRLAKRFHIFATSDGTIHDMQDYYTFADRNISSNIGIGDLLFNSVRGWYVQIGRKDQLPWSEQNTYHVLIRAFGTNVPVQSETYLSNNYTTDTTVLGKPIPQLPLSTVLRSGSTNYPILSTTSITNSAEVSTDGMVAGAALTADLQKQITTLNTNLADLTAKMLVGDYIFPLSGITETWYRRVGNLTEMNVLSFPSITALPWSSTTLFYMPSELSPLKNLYCPSHIEKIVILIKTDGAVQIASWRSETVTLPQAFTHTMFCNKLAI